jgi:hypothetical protein
LSTVKRSASATTSHLEDELEALTVEFVGRIVATLKSASFGDVAALSPTLDAARGISIPRAKRAAPALTPTRPNERARETRPRQNADTRAELAERVVSLLSKASSPLGVRALSTELGDGTPIALTYLVPTNAGFEGNAGDGFART